ncbi:DegT/DnrJ/EryC1/StrS family aminotransferase [Candidatus Pacearchaeota archaeon]|nr:DegT/DnrJ/EryC1/StrS family aminotransferase [Candidatus Pacearchaeota archaeon]
MVKIRLKVSDQFDKIVENVRQRYNFKNKNEALNFIVSYFSEELSKKTFNIGVGCADITDLEKKYVKEVLDSERLSYGPFLKKFENKFALSHQSKFAIAVNSGTDALRIAVACLKETENWDNGDEIICPALTFVATSNVIIQNNLKPIFVDIESNTYNLNPLKIEEKITDRTRAIIAVHLFGQPASMSEIIKISKKYKLKIIEDSCETMFAKYRGKSVGSFGDISCFSTYIAHLISTGVGGLAVTNNPKYAEVMRSLANHGRDGIYISIDDSKGKKGKELMEIVQKRFSFERIGYSSRITELEGALGLAQLERAQEIVSKRRRNALYLINKLKKFQEHIKLPVKMPDREHSYMMFPIVIKNPAISKKALTLFLEENGIDTRDMLPLTNQPIYKKLYGEDLEEKFKVAKWINNNGFYIGCHQKLNKEDIDYIIGKFGEFFKEKIKNGN